MEVTNLDAELKYQHLKLGATTKHKDTKQSGKHGEGFKVAALVFRRHPHNHTFRIESSGVKCNFIFNRELELSCIITPITQSMLDAATEKSERQKDGLVAHPTKDVSVYIGEPREGTTSKGKHTKSDRIRREDFKTWLDITLDINPPKDIVKTEFGDLILDSTYKGKFYLQGLLLPSGSMSGKAHCYGYNFIKGNTTRDRNSLATPGLESRQICEIWSAAILNNSEKSADLLAIYTELLIKSLNELGDVCLTKYQEFLSTEVIQRVWCYMRSINASADGYSAFYYTPNDGNDVSTATILQWREG